MASDSDNKDHFIKMCERDPEFDEPSAYRFIGNIQTPLRKQILHISIAQSEPGVEPNGVRWPVKEMVSISTIYTKDPIQIRTLNVTIRSWACSENAPADGDGKRGWRCSRARGPPVAP